MKEKAEREKKYKIEQERIEKENIKRQQLQAIEAKRKLELENKLDSICNEDESIKDFLKHFRFYNPDWKICNSSIKCYESKTNCFRISMLAIGYSNPACEFGESLIVEICYTMDYEGSISYRFDYIVKPLNVN
ncbi:MAG: hypothetical protein IPK03_12740 [Bacteroidetes bacterium]|nr:hypothetical protein [Bacteroidota bacterium]